MKQIYHLLAVVVVVYTVLGVASVVSAHQPRITEGLITNVPNPEVSKAYYAKLSGKPHVYYINAPQPFALYVNVLVPDIAGQQKDVSAVIIKKGDAEHPLATLDGIRFTWEKFFEPFGYDSYWKGPEYKARVEAGEYEIMVWSAHNDSKYSLAIGEVEAFDFKEGMNAITLVPQLKRTFFNESPANFIFSPFGWGYVLALCVLSFLFGFLYRSLLRKFSAKMTVRSSAKNIDTYGRTLRAGFGLALFVWAITTSWSPILLFAAGFCFFEALFSWCGFFAAIGKSTCPIE